MVEFYRYYKKVKKYIFWKKVDFLHSVLSPKGFLLKPNLWGKLFKKKSKPFVQLQKMAPLKAKMPGQSLSHKSLSLKNLKN